RLTDAARKVLKGDVTVSLREEPERPRKRERVKKTAAAAVPSPSSVSAPLIEALRTWRSATAREHGVPAYVVFHHSTPTAGAATRRRTLDELRGISGIGVTKLERYGEALLAIVACD